MPALMMRCALRTDVGRRPNNEDALFATSRLAAVADGVGGATAGEVASQIVIQEMASLEKRRLENALADELRTSVSNANETLRFVISCRPQLDGMASTLTAVALSNDGSYLIASVGDSRAYLFRGHTLTRLTRDQSLVQSLIESGALTEERARSHPQRSVVLGALDGAAERQDPEVSAYDATAGDRLLLCSDGLSDVVPDPAITAALEQRSREQAAQTLVDAALRAGGADNISVVVVDVNEAEDGIAGWLDVLQAPRRPAPPA